jgi:hypothetical protein
MTRLWRRRQRASARTFCAPINKLIDWRNADPERITQDVALAQRLHHIATVLTGDATETRFH